MTTYSKYNFVYRLQKWMDSVPGQTFLNYAYSWGASIVILGTLFKLTHLPGANFFLFLGMGTEVFVFFISAFDRPFDKTTDGMELDNHFAEEGPHVVANGEDRITSASGGPSVIGGGTSIIGGGGNIGSVNVGSGAGEAAAAAGGTTVVGGGGGGTVIIGGMPPASDAPKVDTEAIAAVSSSVVNMSGGTDAMPLPKMNPELEEATTNYVDELKKLTEMLAKVSEQSEKLGRNSEEMENLDRTLTGICKVYEMQLKSASAQIGTIDEINEQTRKMAAQIVELNQIYTRMIEAMSAQVRS